MNFTVLQPKRLFQEASDGVVNTSFDFMNQLTIDVMTEAQKLQTAKEAQIEEEKRLAKEAKKRETQKATEEPVEQKIEVEIEEPVSEKLREKFAAKMTIRDRAARIRAMRQKAEKSKNSETENEKE